MGRLKGSGGSVETDGTDVDGIKSWTLDYVMNVLEITGFDSSGHKEFLPSIDEWSGSFEGYKEGAPLATVGTAVTLHLKESDTANQEWSASAILTAIHSTTSVDGLVTYSYDFQGTGNLTTKATA